jgi:hydrogenase maturation factor
MCLTTLGRVSARSGDEALVETQGRLVRLSALLVPDIAPGDDCLVGLGVVLERLDADQAARLRADLAPAAEWAAPTGQPGEANGRWQGHART